MRRTCKQWSYCAALPAVQLRGRCCLAGVGICRADAWCRIRVPANGRQRANHATRQTCADLRGSHSLAAAMQANLACRNVMSVSIPILTGLCHLDAASTECRRLRSCHVCFPRLHCNGSAAATTHATSLADSCCPACRSIFRIRMSHWMRLLLVLCQNRWSTKLRGSLCLRIQSKPKTLLLAARCDAFRTPPSPQKHELPAILPLFASQVRSMVRVWSASWHASFLSACLVDNHRFVARTCASLTCLAIVRDIFGLFGILEEDIRPDMRQ